jgi:hypothetical protein
LCLDLLSVHVIRNVEGNTIISYHSNMDLPTTGAEELHDRIRFAGRPTRPPSKTKRLMLYRPKCLLAKDVPTFPRSLSCPPHVLLACGVLVGSGPGAFVQSYLSIGSCSPYN